MFKYAIFLAFFGVCNTDLFAMRPAAPTDTPTGTAAGTPAHDVVVDLTDALNRFVLVETPDVLTTTEQQIHTLLVNVLTTREVHCHFAAFMKRLRTHCHGDGINLRRVCSFPVPAGRSSRSLVDHAIYAGCPVSVIQELYRYGAPVNFIESKKPTLETAWNVDKNPDRANIIAWLLKSDPKKPNGIVLGPGFLQLGPDAVVFHRYIEKLHDTNPAPDLYSFAITLLYQIAGSNTPGHVCNCGKKDCGSQPEVFKIFVAR